MLRKWCEGDKKPITENKEFLQNGSNEYLKNESLNVMDNNKNCCVCLNNFLALNSLSKSQESDISLLTKLQINIPQIVSVNLSSNSIYNIFS